jgi:AcrR family transcriptional regulator
VAGRKRGRPRRHDAPATNVEQRILDSACNLFYREGLHAVGIDRVLTEAGAAKASLYAHYSSKDELVAAYLERQAQEWRAVVRERLASGGTDGRGRLLRLFDLLQEWTESPGFRGCPFLNSASELPDTAHPAREAMRRHREWLHALVRECVVAAGVREVERVTRAVIALHDGAAASVLMDGDRHAVEGARWAVERLLGETRPRAQAAPGRAAGTK